MLRRLDRYSLALLLVRVLFAWGALAIITASLLPAPAAPPLPTSDKLAHLGGYAVLSLLGALSFYGNPRRMVQVGVACFLMGALLEAAQSQIPGRYASLGDAAANLAGAAIGTTLPLLATHHSRRRALPRV
jgi:VanZ family protein